MPEQLSYPSQPEHEHVPAKLVDNIVDASSTGQARLLALTVTALDPSRDWTSSDLVAEVNGLQGDEPGWQLPKGANGMMFRYSEAFEKLELVSSTTGAFGRRIRGNEATADTVLAVTGTLWDWQLRHPDIPLQSIFGGNYREAPEDKRGHSSLRLAIIGEAAKGSSNIRIAEALNEDPARVDAAIRELAARRILRVQMKTDRDERMLRISRGAAPSSTNASPVVRALWNTARALAAEGVTRISGTEFLERLAPDIDKEEAWRQLVKSLAQDRIRTLGFEPMTEGKAYTNVTVNPEFAQALADLRGQLDILRTGNAAAIDAAKKHTLAIVDNTWAASRMMSIAQAQTQTSGRTEEQPHTNVPEAGSVAESVHSVLQMLPYDRTINSHAGLLRALVQLEATWKGTANPEALSALEAVRAAHEHIRRVIGSLSVASFSLQQYKDQLYQS